MIDLAELTYNDFVDSEVGKMFSRLMWEAEISSNPDERNHGEWLRQRLNEKIAQHSRRYH